MTWVLAGMAAVLVAVWLRPRPKWREEFDAQILRALQAKAPPDGDFLSVNGAWNGVPVFVDACREGMRWRVTVTAQGLPVWLDSERGTSGPGISDGERAAFGSFVARGGTVRDGAATRQALVDTAAGVRILLDDVANVVTAMPRRSVDRAPLEAPVGDRRAALIALVRGGADDAPGIFRRATAEDSERLRAFRELSGRWPVDADRLAPELLGDDCGELRAAAAHRARHRPTLIEVVRTERDPEIAHAALLALGEFDAALLIARWETVGQTAENAALMGSWGGREAANVLVAALSSPDRHLSEAADAALYAIRIRLGDEGAGHVSLAVEGGEVSVAARAGEVSE